MSNITDWYRRRFISQNLNKLSDTEFLDSEGDYHGQQHEKWCYDFDGVDGHIEVTPFVLSGAFEIEFDALMSNPVSKHLVANSGSNRIYTGESLLSIRYSSINTRELSHNFDRNNFHKYLIERDALGNTFLYVDGVLVDSDLSEDLGDLTIRLIGGKDFTTSLGFLEGQLAEFKVTDKSAGEDLKLWFKCEEQQGTTAFDSSGNGNHGTIIGGVTHIPVREPSLLNYTNEVGYTKGMYITTNDDVVATNVSQSVDKIEFYVQTLSSTQQILISYNDTENPTFGNIIMKSNGTISARLVDGVSFHTASSVNDGEFHQVIVDYVNNTISIDGFISLGVEELSIATYNDTILIGGGEDVNGEIFSSDNAIVAHVAFTNGVTDLEYELSDIGIENRTIAIFNDYSNGELIDDKGDETRTQFEGRYYKFDGIDDNIQLSSAIDFSTNDFSFGAWVLKAGTNTIGWFGHNGGNRVVIYSNGTIRIRLLGVSYISSYTVSDLVWTHISVNVDRDGNADLYINGFFEEAIDISAADGESFSIDCIGHDNGVSFWESGLYGQFFHKSLLSDSEIQSIYKGDASIPDYFYKMDEGDGTISYDSSGNGNHGTLTNITSSFHATGLEVSYSWLNQVGYSDSVGDIKIPRDESDITKDVLGNDLQYTGRVKYNQKVVESPCGGFDGVGDYVDSSIVLGSINSYSLSCKFYIESTGSTQTIFDSRDDANDGVRVFVTNTGLLQLKHNSATLNTIKTLNYSELYTLSVEWDGTNHTVLIDNEEFTFSENGAVSVMETFKVGARSFGSPDSYFKGKLFDFNLEVNGTAIVYYPFTEKAGIKIYDTSGNGNHGTLVTSDEDAFWSQAQDVYHYALKNGFSIGNNLIAYSNDFTQWDKNAAIDVPIVTDLGDGSYRLSNITASHSGYAIRENSPFLNGVDVEGKTFFGAIELKGEGANIGKKIRVELQREGGTFWDSDEEFILTDEFQRLIISGTVNVSTTGIRMHIQWASDNQADSVVIRNAQINESIRILDFQDTNSDTGNIGVIIPSDLSNPSLDVLGNVLSNPPNNWNYPPSKLKAIQTPALMRKFVHGGTFDGSTHYLTANTAINAVNNYDITISLKNITVANCNIIDARDSGNDGLVLWYVNSLTVFRFLHNSTAIDIQVGGIEDGEYRFVWDGTTITVYRDNTIVATTTDSSVISTATNFAIGARNFLPPVNQVVGRISGIKIITDGNIVFNEPLNGTLNQATLTGDSSTFWIEEYNNLLFESDGTPKLWNPETIQSNYLGLNAITSEYTDNSVYDITLAPLTGDLEYDEVVEDLSGNDIIIPRDEGDVTKDITGNDLQFVGKVASDMKFVNSNCLEFDGIGSEITFDNIANDTRIVSYQGTANLVLDTANNKITCSAGTVLNLKLSDGSHYPCAEGLEFVVYDVSGSENHATHNGTWGLQDNYHYNITKGFSLGVNKFDWSENFDNWDTNYAPKSEFLTSGFTDHLGGNKAFRINNTTGNFTLQRQITGANLTNHTFSLWMKTNDGSTMNQSLLYGNNFVNGISLSVSPEWKRFSVTILYSSGYSTWGIYSTTGEIDILIAFAQMEEGSEMTPYQPTGAASIEGVNIPSLADGSGNNALGDGLLNPCVGFGHNNAETEFKMEVLRSELSEWYDGSLESLEVNHSDITEFDHKNASPVKYQIKTIKEPLKNKKYE